MAKYPVSIDDNEGIVEAVNNLLSGPAGLGQNFSGFSAYNDEYSNTQSYLTGNFRIPFSQTTIADLYVPPINITNAEQLDDRTIKYYFTPQSVPPFNLGNGLLIAGITPTSYNSASLSNSNNSINQIGVLACTTDYVIVRTVGAIITPLGTYASGGTITFFVAANYDDSGYTSTDCDTRVTVTGGTDRVFVSGQMTQDIAYTVLSGSADFQIWVSINRYIASPNDDPTNPDYIFEKDDTIARKIYNYTSLSGSGTLPTLETIFTSIIDRPKPAYYRYILEVVFQYPVGGNVVQVLTDQLGLRSISAQVVKQ
jgi:hypothetical protein